jgi:hypothetical protein
MYEQQEIDYVGKNYFHFECKNQWRKKNTDIRNLQVYEIVYYNLFVLILVSTARPRIWGEKLKLNCNLIKFFIQHPRPPPYWRIALYCHHQLDTFHYHIKKNHFSPFKSIWLEFLVLFFSHSPFSSWQSVVFCLC